MKKALLFILLPAVTSYSQFIEDPVCDSIFTSFTGCYILEKLPEIVGGFDGLQSRINYPSQAIANNIEGKVYVLTIIDSTGTLLCSKVIKGIGYGCDEEALRLVNSTKFEPAFVGDRTRTALLAIPIIFDLKNSCIELNK